MVKGWTGPNSCPLDNKSDHVNISYKKDLTGKQDDVYSKGIFGTEQVYECEWNNTEEIHSKLNSYEYTMLNDVGLYNVHAKGAEIEKWSNISAKIDYVECNRNVLLTNRVTLNLTEGRCQKGIGK